MEAASIALALRLTRPLLWDRLDDGVRQRTAAWLSAALTAEPWPCNWELFPVTVGGFLEEIGHEPDASRRAVQRGLERIERWYAGDGWYADGPGRAFDYYNGWALHLYPVLHAHLCGDRELLDRYGDRGAADGTPVRVTGWAPAEGVRAELAPVYGLSGEGEPTGRVAGGPTLFVAPPASPPKRTPRRSRTWCGSR